MLWSGFTQMRKTDQDQKTKRRTVRWLCADPSEF